MSYMVKEVFYTLQGKAATRAGRRCSAGSPAATSGPGGRPIGRAPSASSAAPTSWAWTAAVAASSTRPRPWRSGCHWPPAVAVQRLVVLVKLDFERHLLQPMDGPLQKENTLWAIEHCLRDPRWRLSLQTHKMVGIR